MSEVPAERPIFVIRLTPGPGTDGIKALRLALKILWRRFGLRCLSAQIEKPGTGDGR
jgi:hypothetical protein